MPWTDPFSLGKLRREMPITEVDSLQGAYEVTMLKSGWPYDEKTKLKQPKTIPEKIAGQLVLKEVSWEEAMQQLFQFYGQNKEYKKAINVMRAFSLEHPHNADAYFKAAELAIQLDDQPLTARLFAQAFVSKKTTVNARKIAAQLIGNGFFSEARTYLSYIIEHDPKDYISQRLQSEIDTVLKIHDPPVSTTQKVTKALHQARIYQMVGEDGKATEYINRALQLDPTNTEAQSLAKKINPS